MKNGKAVNLKNMKEALVNYSGNQKEFSKIWNEFYGMLCMGFISLETWIKFYKQCNGWYYDEYSDCIRDERHCQDGIDNIVWDCTSESEYRA